MACGDMYDGLQFLSIKAKNKLNEIAYETANFILISKFKRMDEKWLKANVEATETVRTLNNLKSKQIFNLFKELYDDCSQLSAEQEKSVLKYLYKQTDKKSLACRLGVCNRDFYDPILHKFAKLDPNRSSNKNSATELNIQNSRRVSYEATRPMEVQFQYEPEHFQPNEIRVHYSAMSSGESIAYLPIPTGFTSYPQPRSEFRSRRRFHEYMRSDVNNNYNRSANRSFQSDVHTAPGFNSNNCNCTYTNRIEHAHGENSARNYQRVFFEQNENPSDNNVATWNGPNRMRTCTAPLESRPDKPMKHTIACQEHRQVEKPSTSTSINYPDSQCVVLVSTQTERDLPIKMEDRKPNLMGRSFATIDDSDTDMDSCDYGNETVEKKYVSIKSHGYV